MNRLLAAALVAIVTLIGAAPAHAAALLNVPIAGPVTALVSQSFQLRAQPGQSALPASLTLQANFTYGSGGTTADAWVQTSLDGGLTWCDVTHFAFTTASARSVTSVTSLKSFAQAAPTDGTLAAGNVNDGLFGPMWRVKYTTTGTYAGTSLRIDAFGNGITSLP
ncbi:hypothetical protein [Bradyrhizobium sp.]|uniref:hypothetical protein n=1 Tax=Bradyrhizobium sp. TaxID=376 RepID=UPI001EBEA134|nr:hypothetical protein [Bradyrhizobium sp.]MBV9984513.1 hypothetical protein [Bradyrhizobium sp.]